MRYKINKSLVLIIDFRNAIVYLYEFNKKKNLKAFKIKNDKFFTTFLYISSKTFNSTYICTYLCAKKASKIHFLRASNFLLVNKNVTPIFKVSWIYLYYYLFIDKIVM